MEGWNVVSLLFRVGCIWDYHKTGVILWPVSLHLQQVTHELAVCFSLLAASSPRGQGASGFAANEAEMGKFCCSLSVWIPFTELPGSKSNCCTFLYIDEEGDVEIGRQHVTCICAAKAVSFYLSWHNVVFEADVCYVDRQSFSVLPQMSCITLAKTVGTFCKINRIFLRYRGIVSINMSVYCISVYCSVSSTV